MAASSRRMFLGHQMARRTAPADLPGWPRLLTITLAAAYTGHSVSSFHADVGRIWPQAVVGTRRRVWDRLALDQTIDRMPEAAIGDREAYLAATEGERRDAWNAERRKRKAKTDAKG
jgi:hypothetical protein